MIINLNQDEKGKNTLSYATDMLNKILNKKHNNKTKKEKYFADV